MGLLCRIANDTARNSPAAPQARRQTVEKGKEAKEESGEKLAVAKPCIFAQQSASHAANAAKAALLRQAETPAFWLGFLNGADYEARTRHLLLGKQTLYQMS